LKKNVNRKKVILVSSTSLLILFLLVASVCGEETVQFFDDFESYSSGVFPSAGGWSLWYSGAGSSEQRISSDVSSSGQKSLRLHGQSGGIAAIVGRTVTTTSDILGFSAKVWVDANGGTTHTAAGVYFGKRVVSGQSWGAIAGVAFTDDGNIEFVAASDSVIQDYQVRSWYEIRVELNITKSRYSLWINNQLKASEIATWDNYGKTSASSIDNFVAQSSGGGQVIYIEDVKVFTTTSPSPSLLNVPPWGQWTFWTTIALGATTIAFGSSTIYYKNKLNSSQKASSLLSNVSALRTCPNCGARLPEDSKYCGKCGTSLQ
jgi:hypothetical protein